MQELQLSPRHLPELDPGFVPAALWNREFRRQAEASGAPVKLALVLERANGTRSRFDTVMLPDCEENFELNFRYVERIVKFLLWSRGGWKLTVGGSSRIGDALRTVYAPGGERAFDYDVMGRRIYDRPFSVENCSFEAAPAANEIGVRLGRQQREVVALQTEGAGAALLALPIIILHPLGDGAAVQHDDRGLRVAPGLQVLGEEHVALVQLHVLREGAADDFFIRRRAGDEVVGGAGLAEVEGPGVILLPRPRDEVEREEREDLLERRVDGLLVAQAVLHQVQVIIHKER